jgi:hypothetical protein
MAAASAVSDLTIDVQCSRIRDSVGKLIATHFPTAAFRSADSRDSQNQSFCILHYLRYKGTRISDDFLTGTVAATLGSRYESGWIELEMCASPDGVEIPCLVIAIVAKIGFEGGQTKRVKS